MATAAVEDVLPRYKIDPKSMGKVLIINNDRFTSFPDRRGAEKDVERLRNLFLKIGFENEDIYLHENKTVAELEIIFDEASSNLVKPEDSTFVLCVMSHGFKNNRIRDKDSNFLHLWHNILSKFCDKNCKNLAGIPKLVITQFCQGESQLVPIFTTRDDDDASTQDESTIPEWADLLLLKASPPYHEALRSKTTGSIFIQTFCDVCEQYFTQHPVTDIMTLVVDKMASMENIYVENPQKVQVKTKSLPGTAWNSLRKKFYLTDKIGGDDVATQLLQDDMNSITVIETTEWFIQAVRSDSQKLTQAASVIQYDKTTLRVKLWSLTDDESWRARELVVDHTLNLQESPVGARVIAILENMLLLRVTLYWDCTSQVIAVDPSTSNLINKSQVYRCNHTSYCCYKSQVMLCYSSGITQLDAETLNHLNTWTHEGVRPRTVCSNNNRAAVYNGRSISVFRFDDVLLSHDMIYRVKCMWCEGIQLLDDDTLMAKHAFDRWSVFSMNGTPVHSGQSVAMMLINYNHLVKQLMGIERSRINRCGMMQDPVSRVCFVQEHEKHDGTECKVIFNTRMIMKKLETRNQSIKYNKPEGQCKLM